MYDILQDDMESNVRMESVKTVSDGSQPVPDDQNNKKEGGWDNFKNNQTSDGWSR